MSGLLFETEKYIVHTGQTPDGNLPITGEFYRRAVFTQVNLETPTRVGRSLGIQPKAVLYQSLEVGEQRDRRYEHSYGSRPPWGEWVLFNRGSRSVVPLEQGRALLRHAQETGNKVAEKDSSYHW